MVEQSGGRWGHVVRNGISGSSGTSDGHLLPKTGHSLRDDIMFFGEFEHTVDSKGRVTIPADFREMLVDGMHVTRGLDGCLFVLTPEGFEALRQDLNSLSIARQSARHLSRLFFSGPPCTLDKQGRILLPAPLRQYAGIENEVVIVGVDSRLEIWNKGKWQAVSNKLATDSAAFAEELAELGLL